MEIHLAKNSFNLKLNIHKKLVADAKETGWDVEPSVSRVRFRSKPD